MTDNDIKKALELCATLDSGNCKKCPCREICKENDGTLTKSILDLINRQKAKIEALQMDNKQLQSDVKGLWECEKEKVESAKQKVICACKMLKTAKSEAIKEFADRLKEKLQWDVEFDNKLVFESDIDNLVKEMTEV